jgi:vacuolar-type H+-ATPase subunit H
LVTAFSGEEGLQVSLDALKSITQAEESARKAIAAAIQDSRAAVDEAERAGQDLIEKARLQAEEEAARLIRETEQEVSKEIEDLARTTVNKKAIMRSDVEKRLDQASDYIVGRIVNG